MLFSEFQAEYQLSTRALAQLLGCSTDTVRRIECGEREATQGQQRLLACHDRDMKFWVAFEEHLSKTPLLLLESRDYRDRQLED